MAEDGEYKCAVWKARKGEYCRGRERERERESVCVCVCVFACQNHTRRNSSAHFATHLEVPLPPRRLGDVPLQDVAGDLNLSGRIDQPESAVEQDPRLLLVLVEHRGVAISLLRRERERVEHHPVPEHLALRVEPVPLVEIPPVLPQPPLVLALVRGPIGASAASVDEEALVPRHGGVRRPRRRLRRALVPFRVHPAPLVVQQVELPQYVLAGRNRLQELPLQVRLAPCEVTRPTEEEGPGANLVKSGVSARAWHPNSAVLPAALVRA